MAFYCVSSLKQQSRVDMYSLYSDTYFLDSEPTVQGRHVLTVLRHIFSWFWANSPGFKCTIYCTWAEQANHYTTHFNAYRNVDYNVYLISGKTSSEFGNDMYILKWSSSSTKGNSIEILLSLRKVWKEVIRGRKSKKNRQHNGQKDKQRSTKYYTENERLSNVNPTKNRGWTQMLRKVKFRYRCEWISWFD